MRMFNLLIITVMFNGCGTVVNERDSKEDNPTEEESKGELIYPVSGDDTGMPFTIIITNHHFAIGDYVIANGELVTQKSNDTYCSFSVFEELDQGEVSKVHALRFIEMDRGMVEMVFGNSSKAVNTFAFGECVLSAKENIYTSDIKNTLGNYFTVE